MAVGTSGKMRVKRHHVKEERRRIFSGSRSGKKIYLPDDAVLLAEEGDKFVGVAVTRQSEEEFYESLSDTADVHGVVPYTAYRHCTDLLVVSEENNSYERGD
jgi:hypothetical protein